MPDMQELFQPMRLLSAKNDGRSKRAGLPRQSPTNLLYLTKSFN